MANSPHPYHSGPVYVYHGPTSTTTEQGAGTVIQESGDALAGASDTTGLPTDTRNPDEAVEVFPVLLIGKDFTPETEADLYDFSPKTVEEALTVEDVDREEEAGDPKDSSAAGSALAALYEQLKTPDLIGSVNVREMIAAAEKANMQPSTQPEDTMPESG